MYGTRYGVVHEYCLADAKNENDSQGEVERPGRKIKICVLDFINGYYQRGATFVESVADSASETRGCYGLYNNNNVEILHFSRSYYNDSADGMSTKFVQPNGKFPHRGGSLRSLPGYKHENGTLDGSLLSLPTATQKKPKSHRYILL